VIPNPCPWEAIPFLHHSQNFPGVLLFKKLPLALQNEIEAQKAIIKQLQERLDQKQQKKK
jgi:hypothetical protein